MESRPAPFDSDAPLGDHRAIIRRAPDNVDEVEMVDAIWGSNPRFSGGMSYRFMRSEGQTFRSGRCLIAASEIHMTVSEKRYRITLDCGNFFYLAGVWEAAMGGWPLCYRVITVYANAEVSAFQERHGAIIQRRQVMQWLDHLVPETEILTMPSARMFRVVEINPKPVQTAMAF